MTPADESGRSKTRAAPRIQLSVSFSSGRLEGTGFVQDISLNGARIRLLEKSGQPKLDTMVDLWFSLGTNREPVAARGWVVRSSPDQFAVEFVRLDEKVQRLLLAMSTAASD